MKKLLFTTLLSLSAVQVQAAMQSVTAVSQPTGMGQRVSQAVIQYDELLKPNSIQKDAFQVSNRQILSASVSSDGKTPSRKAGRYVILTLNPSDADAAMTQQTGRELSVERKISLNVQQTRNLIAANGKKVAPKSMQSEQIRNEVMDDFKQLSFKDPKTGIEIKYNLYIPKNYNPRKKYPLVMFIHDAGTTNTNVRNTLLQGNGATAWASPAFQAKHEAFVLAPQFDHAIVNDNSDDPADLDPTVHLIQDLMKRYSIDSNRLYTTGQSGGAMMSIAMNIKYPDLFAASYIVAGQWAAEKTAPMAKNKLMILVSEDDSKAFPGENAITQVLVANGGKMKESHQWNGSNIAQMQQQAHQLLQQKPANIYYATIKSGTLPMQVRNPESKGAAHMGTWEVSYQIEPIKQWLLQQRKGK